MNEQNPIDRRPRLLTLALLLLVPSFGFPIEYVHADEWTQFRGGHADGKSSTKLPTTWTSEANVKWRSPLAGAGWSSPVVAAGRVYVSQAVTNDSSKTVSLNLLIIDADDGSVVKTTELFRQGEDAPKIHNKNSHASPTPLIHGDRIYVHFGHQGTACVDLDGNIVWRNESLGYPPVHGNGGSPAVVDQRLVFSRDGADINEITALDTQNGSVAWSLPRGVEPSRKFSFCTPLLLEIDGNTQLILPGSDVVQSVNPKTGEEVWRVTYSGYSVVPRPIVESGLVFVCTGFGKTKLLAIDPSGHGDVTETHVRWIADSNIPKTPSLVSWDGKVALVSDNGIAMCFNALSGDLLWRHRVSGNFSASPLLAGNNLYLTSEEGVTTVLDVSGEKPVEIAENATQERTLASMAVIEDDLLLRTEKALYRIGHPE